MVKEFPDVKISDALDIALVPKAGEPIIGGVELIGTYEGPGDQASK